MRTAALDAGPGTSAFHDLTDSETPWPRFAAQARTRGGLDDIAGLREAQLRRAIDSRDVIGQAKGILMSRRGLSAADAFDALKDASQKLNVTLVKIAEIVAAQPDVPD